MPKVGTVFFKKVLSFLFLFVRVSSLHFRWSSQQAELDLKSFIWKRGHNNDDAFNPRFTWAHKEVEFKWTRLILKPEENLFHLNKKKSLITTSNCRRADCESHRVRLIWSLPLILFSWIWLLLKLSLKLVTTVLLSTVYFSILGK